MSAPLALPLSFDAFSWSAVLADAAVKGIVILALTGMLAVGLRKGSAAARHLVWSIAFTILLMQPALSLLIPGWSLQILPATAPLATVARGLAELPKEAAPVHSTAPSAELSLAAARPQSGAPEVALHGRAGDWGWLLRLWLAGATLLGLRLAAGIVRILRLLREASPLDDETWTGEVQALCRRLGISRRVRVLAVGRELMPITWGLLRPVIVLPAAAQGWPSERRRVVLLHELAHVRRWDCLTQGIAQVACALHWLNPLAWTAAGRLLVEREHACDDQVLLAGTRPSDYAAHLVDIAQSLRFRSTFYPASAAALGRRSRLESRVRSILSFSGERGATRQRLLVAAGLAVALILPVVLLRPKTAAGAASLGGTSAKEPAALAEAEEPPTEDELKGELLVIWENSPSRYEVTGRGAIELTANATAVARIARDGYLKIVAQRLRDGGLPPVTVRTLSILERGGGLFYEQFVAGQPRPFDAETQQWLARLLPEIVTETGFGAGTRVAHLLRSGGIDKVLAEIAQLAKPRVQRVFLGELLNSGLSSSDLRKVVRFAARELPPDGDLGNFLYPAADLYLTDAQDRAAFLKAAAGIRSEDEYARFMAALLKGQRLAPEVQAELIRSADSRFETDATRAGFLSGIAEHSLTEEALQPVFFETLKAVRDEDMLARLAVALLGREGLDRDLRKRVFETAFNGMVSDQTKASFLLKMGDDCLADTVLREPYLTAARSIREDRSRAAVQELLRQHGEP